MNLYMNFIISSYGFTVRKAIIVHRFFIESLIFYFNKLYLIFKLCIPSDRYFDQF